MANKQIYQLTETLSVSNDDWLATDLDASNLTRKIKVGNLFSSLSLNGLSDVSVPTPSNGQSLVYNSTSGNWEASTISTSTAWGSITGTLSSQTDLQSALNGKLNTTAVINDISDVDVPTPSNGESLVYNSTSGNWEAITISTSTAWGDITGTLSSQSDLQSALNGKLDTTAVIDNLSDVNAPTPSNGETLIYNSTSSNWENGAVSASVSIGDSIGGASIDQVLFTNASGLLTQNSKFVFDGSSLNFTGASSSDITNSSFGVNAGNGNSGNGNTSVGNGSNNNSTGNGLTSVGRSSGVSAVSDFSVYIGYSSGYQSNGNRNVFSGYLSGYQNNGQNSVGIGDTALFTVTGNQNTAIGSNSLNTSGGSGHVALGYGSLQYSSGNNNIAIGYFAGFLQTGARVLALGYQAGQNNTQSNRVIIGQTNLPQFAGAAAAAAALPAAGTNGIYLYWDTTDNTIKARP